MRTIAVKALENPPAIGVYRLGPALGEGAMATVYAATDGVSHEEVALKRFSATVARWPGANMGVLMQLHSASQVRHPHLVEARDTGTDGDGTPYLVMERLYGETLAEHLSYRGRLTSAEALRILVPVLDGLAAAHAVGLIHGCITPANVILSTDAEGHLVPKLADLGVGLALADIPEAWTLKGPILRRADYLAPEQARRDARITPAADVWAIGAILFETLSGAKALGGGAPSVVLTRLLTHGPPSLGDVDPNVPGPIAQVVDRALSTAVADRFADAAALRDALVEAAAQAELPRESTPSVGREALPPPAAVDATMEVPALFLPEEEDLHVDVEVEMASGEVASTGAASADVVSDSAPNHSAPSNEAPARDTLPEPRRVAVDWDGDAEAILPSRLPRRWDVAGVAVMALGLVATGALLLVSPSNQLSDASAAPEGDRAFWSELRASEPDASPGRGALRPVPGGTATKAPGEGPTPSFGQPPREPAADRGNEDRANERRANEDRVDEDRASRRRRERDERRRAARESQDGRIARPVHTEPPEAAPEPELAAHEAPVEEPPASTLDAAPTLGAAEPEAPARGTNGALILQ